jgi:protein-S-isoprenylcysteine O-methyltransferase Ste14
MKLSKSVYGVIVGGVICLLGTVGVAYFQLDWGGSDFWRWFPVSVIAVALGILIILVSLVFGFTSGLIPRFRRRHDHVA